jgi:hypothetical protein
MSDVQTTGRKSCQSRQLPQAAVRAKHRFASNYNAKKRRQTPAMGKILELLLLAASGLIVDGPSSTRSGLSHLRQAAIQLLRSRRSSGRIMRELNGAAHVARYMPQGVQEIGVPCTMQLASSRLKRRTQASAMTAMKWSLLADRSRWNGYAHPTAIRTTSARFMPRGRIGRA